MDRLNADLTDFPGRSGACYGRLGMPGDDSLPKTIRLYRRIEFLYTRNNPT